MRIAAKLMALGLAGALAGGSLAQAAEYFTVSSTSFKDGGRLDPKYAGKIAGNANCLGQNVSPALSWSNPPAGTTSFAILVADSEGASGLGVVHWVAYGIPAKVLSLAEGEGSVASSKIVGGTNSRDLRHYIGPCAPVGSVHHYAFTVIATDLAPDALPEGLTKEALIAKLNGHALAAAGMVGLYQHP
jgi:Raf kinase inhibitor-like YbhB/YbcL family protein